MKRLIVEEEPLALSGAPFAHKLIHTVRGMGYVLEEQQA